MKSGHDEDRFGSATSIARAHRRQFVVGPREYLVRSDWRVFELGPGLVLSADPDLRVGTVRDRNGAAWFLLGLAAETRAEYREPLEEIARRNTAEISHLYDGWTGRWILIGDSRLHPDAAAMLGCYYGQVNAGEWWTSSSPVLIRRVLEIPDGKGDTDWRPGPNSLARGPNRGISWYPPPSSGTVGVARLLPSQVLDLRRGSPFPRRLSTSLLDRSLSDEESFAELRRCLEVSIVQFSRLNAPDPLTLLLSGGRDSRMLLGVASAAGVSLRTFTRVHSRASIADRTYPQKLARLAGYSHFAQHQTREIPGRREIILEHSGYIVSWLSAAEFLEGGSDPLRGIALAGFCAALGRDRFLPVESARVATGRMIVEQFSEQAGTSLESAFDEWLTLRSKDNASCFDLCDAFFIEQRTGGRKGAKEQIFDIFPVERVPPLNSARIYGLIGRLSEEARLKALWIPAIIRATAPDLLGYPMNPPDDYFGLGLRAWTWISRRMSGSRLRFG